MQQRAQTGGRGRAYVFLGVSLVAAAVVAAIVWQLISHLEKQATASNDAQQLTDVIVAARDLNMGVPLTNEDIVVRALPPNVVVTGQTFESMEQAVGRTPKERILANEVLRRERLAIPGEGIGLNALISQGQRALAVQISTAQAVAAFLQPGNYVDVIVVIRPDDRRSEYKSVAKVLLQGKRVLAVGSTLQGNEPENAEDKNAQAQARKKPVVTLEVSLEEAEQVALAAEDGVIHLALRADVDVIGDELEETEGATASVLIGEPAGQKQPTARAYVAPKVEGPKVEIIEGVDRQDYEFNENGGVKDDRRRR